MILCSSLITRRVVCWQTGAPSQRCTWWRRGRRERCSPWSVWRRSRKKTWIWRTRSPSWEGEFLPSPQSAVLMLKMTWTGCEITLKYLNRIKHENVVGMEDFYEGRTHYYLVMQLWVFQSSSTTSASENWDSGSYFDSCVSIPVFQEGSSSTVYWTGGCTRRRTLAASSSKCCRRWTICTRIA